MLEIETDKTIVVASVMKSGADLLTKYGFAGWPASTLKAPGIGVISDHTLYTKTPIIRELANRGATIIVPFRHPKLCAHLWDAAGKELEKDFFDQWENAVALADLGATFIPMDSDNLDSYIEDLRNDEIQVFPSAGWMMRPEEDKEFSLRAWQIRNRYEVPESVRGLIDDLEPFFAEAYKHEGKGFKADVTPSEEAQDDRKRNKGRQPKNTWRHTCPVVEDVVYTQKEHACQHCGAEE